MARLLPKGLVALILLLALYACAAGGRASGPFPRFAEFEGHEVTRVTYAGDLQLPVDSLALVTVTRATRCRLFFLPICIPGTSIGKERYDLDLATLAEDITRLHLYYRDHGYYGTRIVPSVDPIGEEEVAVRFAIAPGDQVILQQLSIEGTEGIVAAEDVLKRIPLSVGEPFSRIGFLNSADSVRLELLRRGHAYGEVLRNYSLDTIADVAEAQFVAIPGPLVYVDSIVVLGSERLDEPTIRQQLTFDEGDLLRLPELSTSQRNLYGVEMVSFASIELAPDTQQVDADTSRATVLVRLVEAAQYVVDTSVGFGTIDCVRTGGRWANRNFLGGGRRLELSGSLAKIGVGEPLNANFDERFCARSSETAFSERLNYRVAADFQQPRLFSTRTQLNLNLHSQRFTELDIFLRESTGLQTSLARDLGQQTLLTTTATVENGRTLADPIILCVGFETCTEEDLDVLGEARWSNSLAAAMVRDRTHSSGMLAQGSGMTTGGYTVRGGVDWASQLFGSDNQYLRVVAEGTTYRMLRPGWMVSGLLRSGRFLGGTLGFEQGYIPPELRFYAGGPNSVRGYQRNALGPTAYVIRPETDGEGLPTEREDTFPAATGGTQMLLASVELGTPSPFFRDILRFGYFVDAGHVSVPGTNLGTRTVRLTPGVGIRFMTPVGPIRLDVAYNGYPAETGPLYFAHPVRGLIQYDDAYQPESPSLWSLQRLQLHFAVGQAY